MSESGKVTMDTSPQTPAEAINEGNFRNLSAAQVERIMKIWGKIERHSNMSKLELLTLFDSRPETNENDIRVVEDVLYVFGDDFRESALSSRESLQCASYLVYRIRCKLGQRFCEIEIPPPDPSIDGYFETVYSINAAKSGQAVVG